MSVAAEAPAAVLDKPKGHPLGLYLLFGTEMWERFSYYGMRALLVLYMVEQMGWQPTNASSVYKWYTSLVYLTPLLGGFLADRFLGLKRSILIGAVLMAIGHFLMAFEALPIFYGALAFLIAGNGFFKPNISTLVGRMYGPNDPRRDGAFTIFYMGINLGAFLAPLVCGEWLRKSYGFHYGFTAAGVGMVLGLLMFVLGQKRINADVEAAGNSAGLASRSDGDKKEKAAEVEPDEKLEGAGGVAGFVAKAWPFLMIAIAIIVPIRGIVQLARGQESVKDVVMMCAFAFIAGWMGITLRRIGGRARDKSIVIFVLFVFVVLFWMAFEQAGNALNLWAEYNTDRHIGSFEYSAESFQSLNPLLIFALAPLFSMLWLYLANHKMNLSTPVKFLVAMFLMVLSFLAMVGGAAAENGTVTRAPLAELPKGLDVTKLHAGRMRYDAGTHELEVRGVFPSFAVLDTYAAVMDPKLKEQVEKIDEDSKAASKDKPLKVKLDVPAGFAPKIEENPKSLAGWDAPTSTLTIVGTLGGSGKREIYAAASPPEFRAAVDALSEKSNAGRVSGWWLLLSYFLATVGELCLSPVGLSMVTKLAPVRYGSLFMGVWLLASSVAQYMGGSLGELWGVIPPVTYFWIFVGTSLVGAVVLLALVKPVKTLMHGID